MDLTVAKKDLLRMAKRAQAVADKKSTMPVLSNVLLDASGKELVVRATDLYLSVSGSVPAEVRRSGSVAVPPMPPKQEGHFRWPHPCDPKPVGEVAT
jgi:DNA polymerase-3 subunit beta